MRSFFERHYVFSTIFSAVAAALVTFLVVELYHWQQQPRTVVVDVPQLVSEAREAEPMYLVEEEAVIVEGDADEEVLLELETTLFQYIEVTDGCGPFYEGECLNVRSAPATSSQVVAQLRNGVVLKVDGQVENDERLWYKVMFDEWLRYPERVADDWYVAADYVEVLYDEGERDLTEHAATSTKRIVVDRSDQTLTAFDDHELFMQIDISTGLELTPTPRGTFRIFRKTPSRYMQGPLPGISNDFYDLPGVPWNLYFTEQGAVIHGAYWHNSFGSRYSHGCVNLSPSEARELYTWAELGTSVVVRD